jgi:hypothetical protein
MASSLVDLEVQHPHSFHGHLQRHPMTDPPPWHANRELCAAVVALLFLLAERRDLEDYANGLIEERWPEARRVG